MPVNATTAQMPLELSLGPLSVGWWRMYASLQDSLEKMQSSFGADEKDTDDLRRMFTETSPALLAVTMLVSLLHMLFEVLALKNDVAFWRGRDTPEGLSLRGIVFSATCQVIVLLYLIENESSFLVRVSVAAGLLIEVWKIVRLWSMRGQLSEAARSTARADEQAGNWLLLFFAPCVLGYAAYSLLYEPHSGWYGWLISSLYGLVFALGFVAMTPQLFINYRLKSVEHMPWRTLVYRALNTFIDDLFAFIITMPTMHRLSTFRDDIIFFIFLYQKWIYPIDHTRSTDAEGSPYAPTTDSPLETPKKGAPTAAKEKTTSTKVPDTPTTLLRRSARQRTGTKPYE
uniref:Cleft lip and palate transmembrane protein 1 n=1 Tax=Pyramimonas obovata TaxID=1411642 RepID=A0A7S0QYV0_9CHLO